MKKSLNGFDSDLHHELEYAFKIIFLQIYRQTRLMPIHKGKFWAGQDALEGLEVTGSRLTNLLIAFI